MEPITYPFLGEGYGGGSIQMRIPGQHVPIFKDGSGDRLALGVIHLSSRLFPFLLEGFLRASFKLRIVKLVTAILLTIEHEAAVT